MGLSFDQWLNMAWSSPRSIESARLHNDRILSSLPAGDPLILSMDLHVWAMEDDAQQHCLESLFRLAYKERHDAAFGRLMYRNLINAFNAGELGYWRRALTIFECNTHYLLMSLFCMLPIKLPSSIRPFTPEDLDLFEEMVFGKIAIDWDERVLSSSVFSSPELMHRFVRGCHKQVSLMIANVTVSDASLVDLAWVIESEAASDTLIDDDMRGLLVVRALTAMLGNSTDVDDPLPIDAWILAQRVGLQRCIMSFIKHDRGCPSRHKAAYRVINHFAKEQCISMFSLLCSMSQEVSACGSLLIAHVISGRDESYEANPPWSDTYEVNVTRYL